jgi:hypothetical protein
LIDAIKDEQPKHRSGVFFACDATFVQLRESEGVPSVDVLIECAEHDNSERSEYKVVEENESYVEEIG